VVAGS